MRHPTILWAGALAWFQYSDYTPGVTISAVMLTASVFLNNWRQHRQDRAVIAELDEILEKLEGPKK